MCCRDKGLNFLFAIRQVHRFRNGKADHQIGFPKWFRVEIYLIYNTPLARKSRLHGDM